MTPPNIASLALAALAGLASVFAGISALKSGDRVESLLARVDAVETARQAKDASGPAAPDNSALARDINALRLEVSALATPASREEMAANDAKVQKAWTERMVRAISETLEAKLGLSPEQKVHVADIMTAQYAALAECHRPGISREEGRTQTARVQAETADQIRAALTAEQQAGFSGLISGPAGVFGLELIPNAGRIPGEEGSSGH
jgi:hypothetical protein